jgi:hypothetical protein
MHSAPISTAQICQVILCSVNCTRHHFNKCQSAGRQLVTTERRVCKGPLAFNYVNLPHTALCQSLACARSPYQ